MWHKVGVTLLVFFLAIPALAAEVGGVKLDDKTSVGGQELVLNGAGVRTKAIFKVYVASLYVPQKAADLAAVLALTPRRIQLNLLRNITPDQLINSLVEGLNDSNSAQEVAAVKAQTEQMVTIMKAFKEVKEKDVVTLDFVAGATKVGFNGEAKGTIPGAAFNNALTRVWLGDKPVQPDLKKAMLGD